MPRSKTDVYREGNYVYISASESQYCPVSVLRKYMNLAGIHDNGNLPLFRPLVFTDRQPLFKHDKLKSCAACGVVRKY